MRERGYLFLFKIQRHLVLFEIKSVYLMLLNYWGLFNLCKLRYFFLKYLSRFKLLKWSDILKVIPIIEMLLKIMLTFWVAKKFLLFPVV